MRIVVESLFVQETTSGLFIKAVGHITAALSVDLKTYVHERLDRMPFPDEVFIDLSECFYMDSTFMGLIVGFHKKFKQNSGKALTIWKPSPECTKLLSGLGILKILKVVESPVITAPSDWQTLAKVHNPSTEVLLGAHENLSEISEDNAQKFSSLQNILKQKLESEKEN